MIEYRSVLIGGGVELYRSGRLPLDKLVIRPYELDELPRAFEELGVEPGRAVITF